MEASISPISLPEPTEREVVRDVAIEAKDVDTSGVECRARLLYGHDGARWLRSHAVPGSAYWQGFLEHDSSEWVANIRTTTGLIVHGANAYPITIDWAPEGNAYPSSLLAQYIDYPLTELDLIDSPLRRLGAWLVLKGFRLPLLLGQVERTVQWNSWLLSTNLIPAGLVDSIPAVTEALVSRYPSHAVLLKNVNALEHPHLPDALTEAGYELFASRQVYLFDGRVRSFASRSDVRRDYRLLQQLQDYRQIEHHDFSSMDAERVTSLYQQLYLDKHSRLNPQYTQRFVQGMIQNRTLELRGLRHTSGRIDGVFACFRSGGSSSTPFIGYDTSLPQSLGLYRSLVAMMLERVAEGGLLLNYSSGAGEFKRRRGGVPTIEYNAVYTKHLGVHQKAAFRLLRNAANRFGRRFLEVSVVLTDLSHSPGAKREVTFRERGWP